ncbi:MAG: gliding motility-associated C-terminal domain-containing protein [Bacteroidales bacterium]|nr:gliding motility-associated C-terminal domain-containing protein [Bacteroidales bacterium]
MNKSSKQHTMKDIRDILDNHSEQPGSVVWERVSSELDLKQVSRQKSRAGRFIALAAAVALVSVAALIVALRNTDSVDKTASQPSERLVEAVSDAEMTTHVDETTVEIATKEVPVVSEKEVAGVESAVAAMPVKEAEKPDESATTAVVEKKTNARQIVLPSNSTLARQLQSDPILKNLSGEEISLEPPVSLKIPNLFTPNGDGVNDTFVVEGVENYSSTRLVVRDRGGKVVFQRDGYMNDWDGSDCGEGVYSYEFFFTYNGIENCATGKVRILKN